MSLSIPSVVSRASTLLAVALLCAACASQNGAKPEAAGEQKKSAEPVKSVAVTPQPPSKAQQELAAGVASYEDGAYKQATKQLQTSLALGLESGAEQAKAHKYLAFMHCVGKRQTQCRDEFSKAMAADPAFDLSPAEAGHPTWGPVFRKLKAAPKAAK